MYSTVCGGHLMATPADQDLYSHATYGDKNYDNNEDCDWTLTSSQEGYNVRLRFSTFEVEDEMDCTYDYVEVRARDDDDDDDDDDDYVELRRR